jgi:hypothetical protein
LRQLPRTATCPTRIGGGFATGSSSTTRGTSSEPSELHHLLAGCPELRAGLRDHLGEVLRIAARMTAPYQPPSLPDDAPAWERDWWRRREAPLLALDDLAPAQPAAGAGTTLDAGEEE